MHWGAGSGWFFGMHLAWWIFWIVAALAIWATVRRSAPKAEAPFEVLRRRYAEGALTTEEYDERRAKLAESGTPH